MNGEGKAARDTTIDVPSVRGVLDTVQNRLELASHKADMIMDVIRPSTLKACDPQVEKITDQEPMSTRAQKLYEASDALLTKLCEIIEALG